MSNATWTSEEETYFMEKVMPLSQYMNGKRDDTREGLSLRQLGLLMQMDMGCRARRRYTRRTLLEHYLRKFRRGRMRNEVAVRSAEEDYRLGKAIARYQSLWDAGELEFFESVQAEHWKDLADEAAAITCPVTDKIVEVGLFLVPAHEHVEHGEVSGGNKSMVDSQQDNGTELGDQDLSLSWEQLTLVDSILSDMDAWELVDLEKLE